MYVTMPFVDSKVLSLDAYLCLKDFAYGSDGTESGFSFLVSLDYIREFKKDVDTDSKNGHEPVTVNLEILRLFEELIESEYSGLVLVLHETEQNMVIGFS